MPCCRGGLCTRSCAAGAPSKRAREAAPEAGGATAMEVEGGTREGAAAPATKAPKVAGGASGAAPGADAAATAPLPAQEGDCLVYVSALGLCIAQCACLGLQAGLPGGQQPPLLPSA